MATVNYTADYRTISWSLDTGDDGQGYTTKQSGVAGSVQFVGLSDSTAHFEASNDGTNYAVIRDVFGGTLTITADGFFEISTTAKFVRPRITGGTDTGVLIVASFQS